MFRNLTVDAGAFHDMLRAFLKQKIQALSFLFLPRRLSKAFYAIRLFCGGQQRVCLCKQAVYSGTKANLNQFLAVWRDSFLTVEDMINS
jgi:hypothetical protein